jgi:hypothetical protein
VPEDVPPSSAEPKLSPQERRRRRKERLAALRLRMAIGRELDERGIAEPAAVGAALGMPAAEATKLLSSGAARGRCRAPCGRRGPAGAADRCRTPGDGRHGPAVVVKAGTGPLPRAVDGLGLDAWTADRPRTPPGMARR